MDKLEAVTKSVSANAGARPSFLQPADQDQLLAITLALAGEVATLYERLDTLERLAVGQLGLPAESLSEYTPDSAVLGARSEWHDAFAKRLLRSLTQELSQLRLADGPPIPATSAGE